MNTDFSILSIGPYTLVSGQVLPEVEVAYVAHGQLAPDGRNAVLVTHGYTSGPSMLSRGHHTAEGSWAPLLGPGRPLDTDRHYIVCANMLGSSFGTTGPRSLRPDTGRPWGPDFPAITLEDIVGVQRRLLERLGVRHLKAVVGPSYGGWQALQWALSYPDWVGAAGVLMSGPCHPEGLGAEAQRRKFEACVGWHGGWHYGHPEMEAFLFQLRLETMRQYGLERLYEDRLPDPAARRQALEGPCRDWARKFDPNSLVALAGAAERFDVRNRLHELRCRLLHMVCTTDLIFPPTADVRALVQGLATEHRYIELDSPYGHMASGVEWRRFEQDLYWLLRD